MSINDDFTTSVSSENDSVAHEDYSESDNNEQKNKEDLTREANRQ